MPRQLPANVQAERFVIAAALADTASAKFVLTSLKEEDFTINQYRYIFGALEALNEREAKLDITSVASMLVEQNHFDEVGGTEMLSKLLDDFISSEGLDENINILLDKTNESWKKTFTNILKKEDLDKYLNIKNAEKMYAELLKNNIGNGIILSVNDIPHCIAY